MKCCLYCYEPVDSATEYHSECSRRFFGTPEPPVLDVTLQGLLEIERTTIIKGAIAGVQTKVMVSRSPQNASRLKVVGLWGDYIVKPPSADYQELPENESLTMHLAGRLGIVTAEHSLIRMDSGELAYITKRFDRIADAIAIRKLHVEDMCQLTTRLAENKYRGSMEQVWKAVQKFATYPHLERKRLYDLILFSYITGNSDMHLKNFSLLIEERGRVRLSPAYDLLNVKLAVPDDLEDLALSVNGKKRNLRRGDLRAFAEYMELHMSVVTKTEQRISRKRAEMTGLIEQSFLSPELRDRYHTLLGERLDILSHG